MQQITTQLFNELLDTYVIKKKLRSDLKFLPESIDSWADREFLAVTDRHHSKGVLITDLNKLSVMPFRLHMRKASNSTGRLEAIVCDFCSTWQRGSNSAVITFDRSDKNSRSYLCCADLLCSLHVRGLTPQATLSRTQLREQLTPSRRIERLCDSLCSVMSEL